MDPNKNNDYMSYKLSGSDSQSGYTYRSTGRFKKIIIGVLIVVGIVWLLKACHPKCAVYGCDHIPSSGSDYCPLHDPRYNRLHNNYYTPTYTTVTTPRPVTTTSYRVTTRKVTKTTTTRKTDEYDVQDYDDPEDFYEDHYDCIYRLKNRSCTGLEPHAAGLRTALLPDIDRTCLNPV